jgi:DNA-binding CsgD family transcriptional regulator
MARSKRLRLADVRAIFRLIGECRELGVDATLWRTHMLVGLLRLTGGQVAMGGPTGMRDGFSESQPVPTLDLGWDGPRERGVFLQFLQDQMHLQDPALVAFGAKLAALRPSATALTVSRRQLAEDATWYGSTAYCEYHRPSRTDDGLMSDVGLASGGAHGIALFRPLNERPFEARHRRLLHLFHAELAPYLVTELAPPGNDPVSSLSPRLRQVLACLLEGDSEQQAAGRLGLTRDTTHQYVKALYLRLGVSTRGELMARFVRFPTRVLAPA